MDRLAIHDRASVGPGPRKRPFGEINRDWTVVGREAQPFALAHEEDRVEGITQVTCRFGQRVEHLMQIECRAADNLENIGCGGLLPQRLRQIVGAFAQFPEQPRILDGNNCLLGEVAEQLDLLVSERADLLSINHDHADELGVPKHRYRDKRPSASEIR